MIIKRETDVTAAVLKAIEDVDDNRTRELLRAFVSHLHQFIRDVRLSEAEFRVLTGLINQIGQLSNDKHNEAVLLAGSLGVSQLVCLLNNAQNDEETTTQNLLGPFWRMHAPRTQNGGSLIRSTLEGTPMYVDLQFRDQQGTPIADLDVDIWHCCARGLYENQDDAQADMNLRGKFTSDHNGHVWFRSIKPAGYSIPVNTLAGQLVALQNRHSYRPAHVHVLAFKEGYKTMVSQIYADDDPNLTSDVQFGVTESLVGEFVWHDEPHPDNDERGWYSLSHELTLEPGLAALPTPPIE